MLLGLRFIQGGILGLVPVLILAYIHECFPQESKARLVSLYVSGTTLGGILGRFLASYLTDVFSWQVASMLLGALFLMMSLCVQFCMPKEPFLPQKTTCVPVNTEPLWSAKYRNIAYLSTIAFCSLGSYAAICNYISYVLLAPPYNFSHTMIGMLFFVQLFGTVGSLLAGRLNSQMPPHKIICFSILLMLAGILFTLSGYAAFKTFGIAMLTFGLFATHTIASSWCGTLCPDKKEMAAGIYMFAYYCGGSILGTFAGVMFKHWHWYGVVNMSIVEAAIPLLALYQIIQLEREAQAAYEQENLVKAH